MGKKVLRESFGVPKQLCVCMFTKRTEFAIVILPIGVERYLPKGVKTLLVRVAKALLKKLFMFSNY